MNYVEIDCKLNTKSFESQIQSVERKLNDLIADYQTWSTEDGFNEQSNEAIEMRKEIEKLINELNRLKKKKDEVNKEGFEKAKNGLEDIGKSIKSTVTHVAKWALALIGVRSMYSAIRRAISLVSSENENISSQIDIMKSAIANALVPLVQTILNMAVKLMIYINYIFKALTGKALFDFDKAWKNAKKNSGATAKNVSKIKKQLAGFDEMNVLSDTSTSGGGTGAGGIGKLTNPFEGWDKVKIPDWVDKIVAFGKWVLKNWEDVVAGLLLTKMFFDILTGNWASLVLDIILYLITQFPRLKDAVIEVAKGIWEFLKLWVAKLIVQVQLVLSSISALIFTTVNLIKNPFKTLKDTVVGVFNGIKTTVQGVFNVIKGLFTGNMKTVFSGFKQIFKGAFDSLVSIAKTPLNLIIGAINSLIKGANRIQIDIPSWVPGVGGKKFGINIPTIPRLAKGGIINMPGRGVPIAYGGERGQEAVLPLTDSQQMALLGEAIGKYININATVPVYVGNRQIAKEIKKINAESDFAYNR